MKKRLFAIICILVIFASLPSVSCAQQICVKRSSVIHKYRLSSNKLFATRLTSAGGKTLAVRRSGTTMYARVGQPEVLSSRMKLRTRVDGGSYSVYPYPCSGGPSVHWSNSSSMSTFFFDTVYASGVGIYFFAYSATPNQLKFYNTSTHATSSGQTFASNIYWIAGDASYLYISLANGSLMRATRTSSSVGTFSSIGSAATCRTFKNIVYKSYNNIVTRLSDSLATPTLSGLSTWGVAEVYGTPWVFWSSGSNVLHKGQFGTYGNPDYQKVTVPLGTVYGVETIAGNQEDVLLVITYQSGQGYRFYMYDTDLQFLGTFEQQSSALTCFSYHYGNTGRYYLYRTGTGMLECNSGIMN